VATLVNAANALVSQAVGLSGSAIQRRSISPVPRSAALSRSRRFRPVSGNWKAGTECRAFRGGTVQSVMVTPVGQELVERARGLLSQAARSRECRAGLRGVRFSGLR